VRLVGRRILRWAPRQTPRQTHRRPWADRCLQQPLRRDRLRGRDDETGAWAKPSRAGSEKRSG